ncbi:hypothetical protein NEOLI_002863 [Neolecta irregularis DAH-3]|uniref:Uncharacterized protein n=1 Tax=Neolecta irregularis (strain DAH-3) TaxID=1198029 RepID=A0A1U7LR60_NEOID|nr:hypothetical protein NEOLI_002863 [Neolecta irregularis DAH-3]|eukprot:OLL25119.1 hypothetical protein NEOLI_002863 [Neolecta irregularis DAH-3]
MSTFETPISQELQVSKINYRDLLHLVKSLHHEFNHDLAHHLIHSKSETKHKRVWTAWPLPLSIVPRPLGKFKMPSDPLRIELDALFQQTAKMQLLQQGEQVSDDSDTFHLTSPFIDIILEDLDQVLYHVAINRANHGNEKKRNRLNSIGWRGILNIAARVMPRQVICNVEKKCIQQFDGGEMSQDNQQDIFNGNEKGILNENEEDILEPVLLQVKKKPRFTKCTQE